MKTKNLPLFFISIIMIMLLLLDACSNHPDMKQFIKENRLPVIFPDYTEITIPPNIAPLNFYIKEISESFFVKIYGKSKDTIFCTTSKDVIIPESKWRKILQENKGKKLTIDIYSKVPKGKWKKYKSIINSISNENIDNYLAYRLIHPGYENWQELGIYQRNLENFDESPVIHNRTIEDNCVNCHSFSKNNPQKMLIHIRGKHGGTVFIDGKSMKKINTSGKPLISGGVYPGWHPDGKHVAFSVNKISQMFHSVKGKNLIVMDTLSDLIVYNVDDNKIITSKAVFGKSHMETFPGWSADGKYLYYCRSNEIFDTIPYDKVRYDLMRIAFDTKTEKWGAPDTVISSAKINGSISFPKISPNGQYLMFTLADYGTFPIWHDEADLYLLDLKSGKYSKIKANSDKTESYHQWSSNSKWFVFSSKKMDGLWGRSFFSHVDERGNTSKPFVLPQKDPHFYDFFLKSYNLPELITGKIEADHFDLTTAIMGDSIQAVFDNTSLNH